MRIEKHIDILEGEDILDISKSIEEDRNDMAYGSPVDERGLLKKNIDEFLRLKEIIEGEVGNVIE